jgi:hypothetical protein
MPGYVQPEYIVILVMAVPCAIGGLLARNRGRNIIGWGILSAIFPIFLMVLYFNKPLREVPGGFKRCTACREYIKWRAMACKYCSTEQPPL